MRVTPEAQIESGSKKGGKTYGFNEAHDETRPADFWFQESDEGRILFVVFYTQACRWSRCTGCNLPSLMSRRHVSYRSLIAQIDYLFALDEVVQQRSAIRKVIVSNNGSVLDQATFSSTALMYLMARLNLNLPNLAVLCLETRAEYVEVEELEFLARALKEGETPTELELGLGFEAFDDRIRNDLFKKGLGLEAFERFVEKLARYEYRLKCYFMQKPVAGMTDEEAVEDVRQAIDYLDDVARRHRVRINMHLNPTYPARGTLLEQSFRKGGYAPPQLADVARAVAHAQGKHLTLFVGLSDEGLAVEGGSFIRPGDEELVRRLEAFNRTQDFGLLAARPVPVPPAPGA